MIVTLQNLHTEQKFLFKELTCEQNNYQDWPLQKSFKN
jgi:hypothetical protein